MAAHCPKQYLHIGGTSVLQISVNAFLQQQRIAQVFVVVSQDDAYVATELKADPRVTILRCGGAARSDSVRNGLIAMQTLLEPYDWVLVHDAARPGLNQVLLNRLIDTVGDDEVGGLLALPVTDTVKLQSIEPGKNKISTVPRSGLWLAQTPQMFRHGALLTALNHADANGFEVTDEASALEALGHAPLLVEGHWRNTKITRPDDLTLVETFLIKLTQTDK